MAGGYGTDVTVASLAIRPKIRWREGMSAKMSRKSAEIPPPCRHPELVSGSMTSACLVPIPFWKFGVYGSRNTFGMTEMEEIAARTPYLGLLLPVEGRAIAFGS